MSRGVPLPAPLLPPVAPPARRITEPASPSPVAPAAITADTAPAVHITIGRIEVIASPPPSFAAPTDSLQPMHAPQSLDAYLAQRARAR